MQVLIHLTLLAAIALSVYLAYGAWRKDFAAKHFASVKKTFLAFAIWPNKLETYRVVYKVLVTFGLVFMVLVYLVFLISSLPK